MSWRALAGVLALVAGFLVSAACHRELGLAYFFPVLPLAVLLLPLGRRWCLPGWCCVPLAVAWPATTLYFPYMFVVHERRRRERIVREVMET